MMNSQQVSDRNLLSQPSSYTSFGLLRHGTTQWNVEKRIQGHSDSPLTEEGKKKTTIWSKYLQKFQWDLILASDLGRVKATVSILNVQLNLPVFFDKKLREQYWGAWEGMHPEVLKDTAADIFYRQIEAGWNFQPPQGESRISVQQRVEQVFKEAANRWMGKKILVVCHQGIMKCLLYHLAGRSFLPAEPKLMDKDKLHTISCQDGVLKILQLNISPDTR